MTEDPNLAGLYIATVLVDGPADIQFKFSNGEPILGTEFEHGENFDFETAGCGISNGIGGWNRTFTRSGQVEEIGDYCYESCDPCVTDNNPSQQELSFSIGWSMFSTYMIPSDLDFANLLSPIVNQVIIAKNYLGAAYLPEFNFNGIGDLTLGQGYQIKTTESTGVTVTGDYAVPQDNPIDLTAGWNMVAYLRLDPAAADVVLADINATGNLIIAKDYLGAAYLPEWNFNGIGDLKPGLAYQLKVNNADVLQYLSNDNSYRMSSIEVTENNVFHFAKIAPTDNNMTVVIEDAAWDILPTEGSEIAAFDKNGNMVGSAIYSSPVTVITLWGDDPVTNIKDGLSNGEIPTFMLWDYSKNKESLVQTSFSYQINAIIPLTNLYSSNNFKESIQNFNITPNPIIDEATISFFIPDETQVNISVFNILGDLVEVIEDRRFDAGDINFKVNNISYNPGTYFFKITSDSDEQVNRVVISN